MTTRDGYALDLLGPVRHVATEMERAGSDGPAPTVEAMTATYTHPAGDLSRIRQHEGAGNDYEARLWLIRRAVSELGRQAESDGNGGYRLAKPFGELKYKGRKVRPVVRAGDEDEKEVLAATFQNLASELRPFRVTVAGARSSREAELTLHPLAHAIPRMAGKEFASFADDVKTHGVKEPITVMGGKVIDGRHRLAVAAALNLPVKVKEFTGTEDDARHHIVSENLRRRHLTGAQITAAIHAIYADEAKAEAKAAARQRTDLSAGSNEPAEDDLGRWHERAAKKAGGAVSAASLKRFDEGKVAESPQIMAKIESGEIRSVNTAVKARATELGKPPPPPIALGVGHHIAAAAGSLNRALTEFGEGDRHYTKGKALASLAKIEDQAGQLINLIEGR